MNGVKLRFVESVFVTAKIKILIVEDEAPVAITMSFLLTRAGCETEVATTRAEAMQMVKTGRFNLITLDVIMPGMNGFDLCREFKEDPRLRDIPVVFISGQCSLEDQQHGLDAGAADYIVKPFDTFKFAKRLLSHVPRHEGMSY